jgi:hypothetical protein
MRLTVLVPSEEYKNYAGTRIRYDRIGEALSSLGIELSIEAIASFDAVRTDCEMLLISKCHDARSLVIAAHLKDRGVLVGPDLFDDYFSDPFDSRLISYRAWLVQLAEISDFAICSTEAMADVVGTIRSQLPVHVMNDPGPSFDVDAMASELAGKLASTLEQSALRVAWFGVGDNPYFPVGLEDLSAHAWALAELRRSSLDIRLTVLTNKRALSARGLRLIEQLPVQSEVREWTEIAERELLAESFLAFLPVSAQPFSRAKSLNRAFTALSSGCQVLSAGYPLYGLLDAFIYRDPQELLFDLERRELRFSRTKIAEYVEAVGSLASRAEEAAKLARFLSDLAPAARTVRAPIMLVHGSSTREEAHGSIKSVGGLSVASPYTSAQFDFDVVFRGSPCGIEMLIARQAAPRLLSSAKAQLGRGERYHGKLYQPLKQQRRRPVAGGPPRLDWFTRSDAFQLATYRSTMDFVSRQLEDAFGPGRIFVSEHSRLPFPSCAERV